MSQKLFKNVGVETIKGGALQALKNAGNAGVFDFATFTFSGIAVDQEQFDLGGDTYEFNPVLVDSTFEATAEVTAGDTAFTLTGAPSVVPLPGDVVRMETEFMIVIDYNVNGPSMNVVRGAFGSTDATHTAGANTSLFQAAQPVVDGNLAVPLSAVAAATADGQLIGALNFWNTGYRKGLGGGTGITVVNALKVVAEQGAGTSVIIGIEADGGVPDTSDGLDSVTVNFTDGGAGEDFLEATDGTDFLDLGIKDGETITIGSAVANDGAYVVTGVDAPTYDEVGVELTPSKIAVATGSWTDEAQADAITISQATAQTNAVLTAFAGGVEPAGQKSVVHYSVRPDGVDFSIFSPFELASGEVLNGIVEVFDSAGNWKETAGVSSLSTATVSGRLVTIANVATLWVATDFVKVTLFVS